MSGNGRRIRVMFLNHWARSLGGAEYSLIDIIEEISKRADVYLVTSEEGTLCNRVKDFGVNIKLITCTPHIAQIKRNSLMKTMILYWRAVGGFLYFSAKVALYAARLKPDIIHANVPKSHITLFLLIWFGYRGKSVIHMREIFTRRCDAYFLYMLLFPHSGASVIAISEAVRKSLPSRMQKKAKVIYNGIKLGNFSGQISSLPPVKFLYLGRIVPWKGCHLLIEAFKRLLQIAQEGSATLRLTGATIYWGKEYREKLQKMIIENRLEHSVTLTDATEDPCKVFREHHVLCMASDYEPFGRVAAEAQSCGLPVIGFDSGGLPEIVLHGESGVLVPPGDIDCFKMAMKGFIDDPSNIIEMGKKAAQRAAKLFNRDVQTPLIADFILGDDKGQ